MIEFKNISKKFDDVQAIKDLSCQIRDGEIFGLVGTNGAGKSSLLRIAAGIMQADSGSVTVDGQEVYENREVKHQICFLPDSWYTPVNSCVDDMADLYSIVYPDFDKLRFYSMMKRTGMDLKRKMRTFSKGMKKQVSILLGICARTRYLFCDETFDGLDPMMRQSVKSVLATEIMDRDFTPVIASHNLRELEDICDHVGLMHRGGILLSENLEYIRTRTQKVQCVIRDPGLESRLLKELNVIQYEHSGAMLSFVARGERQDILRAVQDKMPVYAEVLPLSLEEIFISETEVAGYDVKNIFL